MRQRIVIVGGGTGGTILANVLAEKLHREIINNKVELLMISDSPLHYYKPAFMYVAFNTFSSRNSRAHSGVYCALKYNSLLIKRNLSI